MLILGWQSPASAPHAPALRPIGVSAPAEVQIPDYERYELPNGLVVYLMEDHELPLVVGLPSFRTGSRFEPSDKVGLASMTGDAMRLGGTQTLGPDELNQELEQRPHPSKPA